MFQYQRRTVGQSGQIKPFCPNCELAPFKTQFLNFSEALGLFSSFCLGPCFWFCVSNHFKKFLIILNQQLKALAPAACCTSCGSPQEILVLGIKTN